MSKQMIDPETGMVNHRKCPHSHYCEYYDYLQQEEKYKPDVWKSFVAQEGERDNKFFMFSYKLKPEEVKDRPLSALQLAMDVLNSLGVTKETKSMIINDFMKRETNNIYDREERGEFD